MANKVTLNWKYLTFMLGHVSEINFHIKDSLLAFRPFRSIAQLDRDSVMTKGSVEESIMLWWFLVLRQKKTHTPEQYDVKAGFNVNVSYIIANHDKSCTPCDYFSTFSKANIIERSWPDWTNTLTNHTMQTN